MPNEVIDELIYIFHNQLATQTTQRELTWEEIVAMQAQAFMSQQACDFEEDHYFNNNEGYLFQPHINIPSYYHSSWRRYEDSSYGNQSIQSQEGSSSNYQEQIRQ